MQSVLLKKTIDFFFMYECSVNSADGLKHYCKLLGISTFHANYMLGE